MDRDEAIKLVRSMPRTIGEQEALRTLIPGLYESEDERTRKELLDFVKSFYADHGRRFPQVFRWISYLEKQKEQKPDIELIQRSWYLEGYQDREHNQEPKWIIRTGEGGPRYEENPKYGQFLTEEQKHTEIDEIIRKARSEGRQEVIDNPEYYQLQKPEKWQKPVECGKNDEIVSAILSALASGLDTDDILKARGFTYDDVEQFLCSIRSGVKCIEFDNEFSNQVSHLLASVLNGEHPYRKDFIEYAAQSLLGYAKAPISCGHENGTGWSEEDEAHRNFILESLEDHIRFYRKDAEGAYCAKQIRTAQNWLKSLRPKPHWKPSKEQMIAFEETLLPMAYTENRIILSSMLEQLKKLM